MKDLPAPPKKLGKYSSIPLNIERLKKGEIVCVLLRLTPMAFVLPLKKVFLPGLQNKRPISFVYKKQKHISNN